jgi:hypothetical protein
LGAIEGQERALASRHAKQVDALTDLMEAAFLVPPIYSPGRGIENKTNKRSNTRMLSHTSGLSSWMKRRCGGRWAVECMRFSTVLVGAIYETLLRGLIALRWAQRGMFVTERRGEETVLRLAADEQEAREMEESLKRVEKDNLARMGALYQRHIVEDGEVAKQAALADRKLLQAHLSTAHRLLAVGVKNKNLKAAREEMGKHLMEAERTVVAQTQVGWCRLTVSKPALKARLVSALETIM